MWKHTQAQSVPALRRRARNSVASVRSGPPGHLVGTHSGPWPRFSVLTRDNSPAANLNLWKKRLGVVPESLWEQTELETLVLADNELKEISPKIRALKKLRMLDLGHNFLSAVPETIGELSGLTDFLYLHDNRLTALPASLGKLTGLRYLNIGENPLEEFPECVCEMAGLIELRATDNGLRAVPAAIGKLARLRELHLRNNKLSSLPGEIGLLRELRLLDLRGNPVTTIASRRLQDCRSWRNWICGG